MNKVMTFAAVSTFCLFAQNANAMMRHHIKHHHISTGAIMATYYGPGFHGHKTASGERFNAFGMTAAHRNLPFGTIVEVVNPNNGRRCRVRVNDRGPFRTGYSLDLAQGAARVLGFSSGLLHMFVVR